MPIPEVNCWYWVSDKEEFIIPCLLVETNSREGIFHLQNGEERKINENLLEQLEKIDTQIFETKIDNLIELHSLTESSVLYVLSILIAVNPFQNIPLYGPEFISLYHQSNHKSLPPHIYALSEQAYHSLLTTNSSQSIIISGESGAGKTESIKYILRYIAHVSRRHSQEVVSIQDKIVEANPLMEAFGNSKTLRNNNSSRFGKLVTLKFSSGLLIEAKITSYLLEKCRVVTHPVGERNYHIFYQLISAALADPKLSQQLNLSDTTLDFRYAHRIDVEAVPTINDLQSFHEVRNAMNVLGITLEDQMSSLKVIAGILLLGNIEFEKSSTHGEGSAKPISPEKLDVIADILGLSQYELLRCLTSRSFGVRSIVTCFYTIEQAIDARDSFAKKLYTLIFDWLLNAININLSSQEHRSNSFIAILDIFGFEAFENNSYEQLLINYCNEKLQYHFNNHIFKMEQAEYAREGIDVGKINFIDNAETVELLERKIAGILSMIDEEINVPRGTDETLLNKILKTYAGSPLVKRAKPSGKDKNFLSSFVVTHYAGEVVYNIVGFLEKNKDSMSHDLSQIGAASTNTFVNHLFLSTSDSQNNSESNVKGGRIGSNNTSKRTLGSQFKSQLNALLDTITQTQPHFVRCLKSNMEKIPNNFDSHVIIHQLRYSGLLEVCKIRKSGYSHRFLFAKFYQIYRILSPSALSCHELVEHLVSQGLLNPNDYCFGNTKLFLKDEATRSLETAWNSVASSHALTIQKLIRIFLAKKRIFHLKNTLINLKKGIKTRDYGLLVESLAVYHHFEYYRAVNRPLISDAKALVARLICENEIKDILSDALKSNNLDAINSAIEKAKLLTPPFTGILLDQCVAKVTELTELLNRSHSQSPQLPPIQNENEQKVEEGPDFESLGIDEQDEPKGSSLPHRRTVFWPLTPDIDLPQSTNHRHTFAFTDSPPNLITAITETSFSPRGRQIDKKPSLNKSETRSLSPPPPSQRNVPHIVSQRSFSPPPLLHSNSYSPPPVSKKGGIRTSVLTRQVSTADINDMETIHEIISNLVSACSSEDGISVDDLDPIEQALQQVQYSGSALTKYASELMMAREELARAKKQLELQAGLNSLTERTPLWKIRNLVQQAEKLGMENYREVKRYRKLFEESSKISERKIKY